MFSIPNCGSNWGWFHAVALLGANAAVQLRKTIENQDVMP
jgi:hypothetical protein